MPVVTPSTRPHLAGSLPRIPKHAVVRGRVQELLDQRLPLTILAAPPGYGKTVALVQWLTTHEAENDSVVWVDVAVNATTDDVWLQILRQLTGDVEDDVQTASARASVESLVAVSTNPLTVFIDSCHHLQDSDVLTDLARLVRRHSRLRVIVATRNLWASVADICHTVDSMVITDRYLGFLAEESLDLFLAHGITTDLDWYRDFSDAVGGWPTVMHRTVLAVLHDRPEYKPTPLIQELMSGVPNHLDHALATARRYVSSTLLPEFLNEEQLEFARLCSVVAVVDKTNMHLLDPELDDVSERLTALVRAGVLRVRQEVDNAAYTMLPLIHDALRLSAEETLSAAVVDSLRRRFVQHYIVEESWPQALTTALETDDPELMRDVVAKGFFHLALTHDALLRQAFARIPPHVLELDPAAHAAKRALTEPQPEGEVTDELPDATEDLFALADTEGVAEFLLKQLILMLGARMTGNLDVAGPWSRKLAIIVEEAARLRPEAVELLLPGFFTQAAVTLQLTGELRESSSFFRRALDIGEDDPTGLAVPNALGALGLHAAIEGDMLASADWIERARRQPPYPGWMGRRLVTSRRCAEAWLAMENLDPKGAEPIICELAGQIADDELWGYIAQVQSLHALLWGGSWLVLDEFARLRRTWTAQASAGSYADLALVFATFDHELALGHATRAENVLVKAPRNHPGSTIRRARLALLSGDPESALAETVNGESLTVRDRVEAKLLRACAELDQGKSELAAKSAERAINWAQAQALLTPLASVPTTRLAQLMPLLRDEHRRFCNDVVESSLSPLPSKVEILRLTDRETVVLRGLADGLTPQLVAHRQFVSVNTVKSQRHSLYGKLGASSRNEALARARRLGLISDLSTSEN